MDTNCNDSVSAGSTTKRPSSQIDHCLAWKDNIGYMPGSSLKFKRDQDGSLCLIDDDENAEMILKKQKLLKDVLTSSSSSEQQQSQPTQTPQQQSEEKQSATIDSKNGSPSESKESSPTPQSQTSPDEEVSICLRCSRSDFKENLVKSQKLCKDCAHIDPNLFKLSKHNEPRQSLLNLDDKNCNGKKKANSAQQHHPLGKSHRQKFSSYYEYVSDFQWEKYLTEFDLESAPLKTFLPEQSYPNESNQFKIGMKLEGIDPHHPSNNCVLSVVDIQGFRLRLHFDGYCNKYDFWVNANYKFIFPPGFCERTGRVLHPPPGINSFDWKTYLSTTKTNAAPDECFEVNKFDHSKAIPGFQKNLKLEAVDIANVSLICVATIRDVLNDQLLIHFDGWDDSFDYWTPVTSTMIHPINWCKSRGKEITPPKDYKGEFNWETYLKETSSEPVPSSAFVMAMNQLPKTAIYHQWKPGMRLEVVDKRNPNIIRVASIVKRCFYYVHIHFDGWEDKYDYWYEEDSPDLHPIDWCKQTKHKLEPPPDKTVIKLNTICPVPCCSGIGHMKWYNFKTHNKEEYCPYSNENFKKGVQPADAETDKFFLDLMKNDSSVKEIKDDKDDKYGRIMAPQINDHSNVSNHKDLETTAITGSSDPQEKLQERINPYYLKLIKENYLELKHSFKTINPNSFRSFVDYVEKCNFKPLDLIRFDIFEVEDIVKKLTNAETASVFSREKIDGITFLCLKREDVNEKLQIKTNFAVKIITFIYILLKFMFNDNDVQ